MTANPEAPGGEDSHRYFAYGSNLHRPQMAVLAPAAQPGGLARLEGWELFVNDHGVLSIRPGPPGCQVLGQVWRCSPADLAVLDRFEAVDDGLYVRITVAVHPLDLGSGPLHPDDGGPCFVYHSCSLQPGRPRPGYLEQSVLPAMQALGLPEPYVARVESWLAHGTAGAPWEVAPQPGDVFSADDSVDDSARRSGH